MSNTKVSSEQIIDDVALGGNPTTTTQSAGNNTTRVATTAFVTTAVSNLVDSAPSSLDTLNELAAAMNDNASFFSTVLPLSGGTMTGNIAHAGAFKLDVGGVLTLDADGSHIVFADDGTEFGRVSNESSNFVLYSLVADKDIQFNGVPSGGSSFTALTLDMSAAGAATFNSSITIADYVIHAGDSNTYFGFNATDNFELFTGGSDRMSIVGSETVFNDGGEDKNFRVESTGSVNMLEVDAGNNRVNIVANKTTVVDSDTDLLANTVIYINGNESGGSDAMRIGPMATAGGYFIDVSNSSGNAQYDLFLNPFNAGNVIIGHHSNFSHAEGDNLQIGTGVGDAGMTFYAGSDGRSSIFFGNDGTNGNVDGAIKYFHESFSTASVRRGIGIITGNVTRGFLSNSAGQLVWGDNAATTPNYPGTITAHRTGDASSTTQNTWSFNGNANGNDRDYGYKASGTGAYAYGVINAAEDTWMSRLDFAGALHLTNLTIQNISDRRLKKDIVDANSQWNDIKALQFKNYKWINPERGSDTYLGLIADEVESVSPNLVGIDAISAETMPDDGIDPEYKNVKYSIVFMKAVKALQEAMTKIETLEAKVKELEG
tara:strand:+ start:792 stop:2594 length:1803 start_codon:yes stop_codon:yes gene_type:complete